MGIGGGGVWVVASEVRVAPSLGCSTDLRLPEDGEIVSGALWSVEDQQQQQH